MGDRADRHRPARLRAYEQMLHTADELGIEMT